MKESEVQKLILDYLRLNGCLVFKVNNGGVYIKSRDCYMKGPIKGVPDIVGLTSKGRFIGVEVKVKYNKPSAEQLSFLAEIKKRKGIALVAYSLDDIIKIKL